ncbi:phage portal protein [Corynebacterium coyleae]|uniref:phage portal protein n=1 Tax=Corynebacterium coyleae TaxID=53374 RepID=UPI001CCB988A|nr:phage portal protein [Corynebacterium coyleae]UBI10042.1 phage portal protein [Corynebacterium coyleae]
MAEAEKVEIELSDAIDEFESATSGFQESEDYYNANPRDLAVGIATPPQLRALLAQVGVPRIYVNAIAERLVIEGFRIGDTGDTDEDLWSWFRANGLDNQAWLAFCETLVYGRSYITIAAPGEEDSENPMAVPDVPIIQVESPKSLYAKIDPRTRRVLWAVRVVKDEQGETTAATLYTPDQTEVFVSEDGELKPFETVSHGLGVVPVVPMIHSDSVADLYGTSLITEDVRNVTDAMSRLLMNMQMTSELMATPQRIIFGSSVDELGGPDKNGLELYTSSYIAVEDPTGKAVQLPAAELRNYTEALTQLLKMAAAYTGLPPQYLTYSDDNPASAEAIKASESRLVRHCEAVAQQFGSAWEQAMRIALLVMGQQLTLDHFRMETVWRDPSTPTFQAKADAVQKAYANGVGIIPLEQARIDMGYSPEQRRQMREWDKESPQGQITSLYGGVDQGVIENGSNDPGQADDSDD